VLALTGGIGSGKSTALAELADVVAALYERQDVRDAVRDRFGASVIRADGTVDRPALGRLAFGDPEAIGFLEGLLHPKVREERVRWVAAARRRRPPPPLIVCEVPLLFEVGAEADFDGVLVVTASEEVRRARVEARGQEFEERRSRQVPEEAKVARATLAFRNDGDLEALREWAGTVLARLARSGAG